MLPPVVLLVVILVLIVFALRSMLRAVGDLHLDGVERALDGEEPHIPDELDGDDGGFAWIHERLVDAYAAETQPWALEQVRRVDARLQAEVPEAERLETLVLWIPEANAFTMPGRHVYLSRRLLERARGDEPVAFIVAHEMAHHHLGHVGTTAARLARLPGPLQAIATDLVASRWFLSNAEREAETDAHALNLCLAAGYDGRRCLKAFDLLEEASLDWGDTEGVFGPDAAIEAALADDPEWMVRAREWLAERRSGYPAIRERKARLLAALEEAEAAAAG
ncbi:MAG TPA: M48 family metalloprotease [Longimicrobium sp.]|nr:M48 family metalloprotease [Longimicrobium sp.]